MKIKKVRLREIFSTVSKKTIEAEIVTEKVVARASVPFGTSAGKHEAKMLPTKKVVENLPLVRQALVGREFQEISEVDETLKSLDGSVDFSSLGANLALAISLACLKAFAKEEGLELFEYLLGSKKPRIPLPVCNVVGGWKGQSDIQEYLFIPSRQESFFASIEKISEAYWEVGKFLKELDKSFKFAKNIESAWVTSLRCEKILEAISQVASQFKLRIGLDVAASQIFDGKTYQYLDGRRLKKDEQVEFMKRLVEEYRIFYLEDPLEEDDFEGFARLKSELAGKALIVGDDLLVTNLKRLRVALRMGCVNAAIVKPNQVGTFTDVRKFVEEAKRNGIVTIMSHRSGETDDVWLPHLAVGLGCEYVKLGISGERVVKINEMIRIEESLNRLV